MGEYQTRKIQFRELIEIDDWKIKIYTIANVGVFDHPTFYGKAKEKLADWLKMENAFNSRNDKIAFLILHSGNEGIFSIINWWVGGNMLNTHIFFTKPDNLVSFKLISGDGLAPCIWELEVINHERLSWIKNVLKQQPDPDYPAYLKDVIDIEM